MSQVVDYSTARPDPAAIKAAGYVGVMRYLSQPGNSKNLTAPELASLTAVGLEVGLVWETNANRTSVGGPAGAQDARAADAMASALGFPEDRPVYFATDGNVFTASILAYYQAAVVATQRPVGVYGNTALIDACAGLGIKYGWKVQTWGPATANACLQQMPNIRPVILGTDVNEVLKPDWGQLGATPEPAPLPIGDSMIRIFVDGGGWFMWKGGNGDPLIQIGQAELESSTLPLLRTAKDSPTWAEIQKVAASPVTGQAEPHGTITLTGTGCF